MKMKHTNRILAMLLALCMIVTGIPMTVVAVPATITDTTAENVSKIMSYTNQIREDNIKTDYSSGGLTWDTEGKDESWRYFNGVMLDAFLMVGGEDNVNYAINFFNGNTDSNGNPKNYHENEVDSVPMALGMFELLDTRYSARYANAIQYVYTELKKQTVLGAEYGYNYWHKTTNTAWETWKFGLDGLYMAGTFLMEYANALDEGKLTNSSVESTDIYKDVYNRFVWVADTMLDEETGLYHHGWNGHEGNGHFWGRGIGWYAVALVDTIEMMPEGEYKEDLISKLPELFDGMLKYQDADTGMWYNVVDKDSSLTSSTGNKLETSVSGMMAYAMMKAYNNGWVDKTYGTAGLQAFNGTVGNKMSGSEGSYTVKDVYQKSGVGTTDEYYCQNSYVSDEAKGTAVLIMAATIANTTAEKLIEEEEPEVTPTPTPEITPIPVIPETLTDEVTKVSVSGSKATAITVTDKSSDTAIKAVLENKLTKYIVYDIRLEDYTDGTTATVSIPISEDFNVENLKAYYVSDNHLTVEEISGNYSEGKYTFTTDHFSTWAVGETAVIADEDATDIKSVTGVIEGGTIYQRVKSIEAGEQYLIVYQSSADATSGYALRNNSSNSGMRQLVRIQDSEAIVDDNEDDCVWTFSAVSNCNIQNGSYFINFARSVLDIASSTITVTDNNGTFTFSGTGMKTGPGGGSTTYYLRYNNNKFERNDTSKNATNFYLYKQVEVEGAAVKLIVSPASKELKPGETLSLTKNVFINDADADTYEIQWESSNDSVATIDAGGTITALADGTATITATLTSVNGMAVANGGIAAELTVNVATKQMHETIHPVLSGNDTVKTELGIEPVLSDIKLTVTYEDETTAVYDVNSGLVISGYDINTVGKYLADITYNGVEYGKVLVIVDGNPYVGLDQAEEPYPVYPEDGAVRIKKTATPSENFDSSGVARVELDVAGISVKQGVDVVLVVDVSNSMAWTDSWFEGMSDAEVENATDQDKIPENYDVSATDKLDQAMAAAIEFANILLADNIDGSSGNNSISFVTFAGQNGATNDYIDSVQTVFTNVQDASLAETSFTNTKFTALSKKNDNGGVDYTLQIGYTDGSSVRDLNRGNTNYDFAFGEAANAITELQASYDNYAASGRETIVVFMTDGAPSHYNNKNVNGSEEKLYGNDKGTYEKVDNTEDQWLSYINNYNTYAAKVAELSSAMYAVGFDLDHGGFSDYSWNEEELEPVLAGITSDDKDIETMLASDGQELLNFYNTLAGAIKMAGENAQVQDIINSDFTLQMSSTVTATNGNLTLEKAPTIEVISYDLVQKTDKGATTDTIGDRTGTSSVLERVTFNADGTEAYSSVIGEDVNIMTSNEDGSEVTIEAFNFTYKKVNGVETFDWNIGTITDKEIALAFDVRLKGGATGERPDGLYYTNEEAILEYIDINGDYAKQIFPMPALAWGGIAIAYEFYLVDEDGNPVSRDMTTIIPINNRITVWGPGYQEFNQNEDGTITATIKAQDVLPAGYALFDETASYSITFQTDGNSLVPISVTYGDATYEVTAPEDGTPHVAFAVTTYPETQTYSLNKDAVVIDYGKAIQVDVLANDGDVAADYTKTVVGYAVYNISTDQKTFFTEFTELGNGTFSNTTNNGDYTIVGGKVQFTPTRLLSTVEKVFAVIKFVKGSDFFYMYNEVDIIPATNVYYETNFADGVFTYTNIETTTNEESGEQVKTTVNKWSEKTDGISSDGPQDDGTIGVDQTYGFDSTYDEDAMYSNSHSYFVDGQGLVNTTVQFTFTGTGFDLISRTGELQGSIRVDIYKDYARTDLAKSVTVLNKSESKLELYQIPVVSVNDLAYGIYYVTIGVNAAYTDTLIPKLNRGGEFYFDAIRIYDPVKGNSQAENAYASDNEAALELYEVRDLLISASDADAITEGVQGVSFIDRTQDEATITDYSTIGPNNEVYLAKDNAIAFKIIWNGSAPMSIDIGAKSIDKTTAHMNAYISGAAEKASSPAIDEDINSATVEFYELVNATNAPDFSNTKEAYVVVENTGEGVLSITDIKVAYGAVDAVAEISFMVDEPMMMFALACFSFEEEPEYSEPEVEPNYDIISAELSANQVKRNKTVILTVKTSEDADSINVAIADAKKAGPAGPAAPKAKHAAKEQDTVTVKSVETVDGVKVWTVEVKIASHGDKTLTVTGYGADGTAGVPTTVNVKVKP